MTYCSLERVSSKTILFILFSFVINCASGQTSETEQASIYAEKARSFTRSRQFDSATYYLQKSAEFYRSTDNTKLLSLTESEIAKTWLSRGKLDKAIEISERVISNSASSVDALVLAYQNLGKAAMLESRDAAASLLNNHKALAITSSLRSATPTQMITAIEPLALDHYRLRNLDSSAYYFEKLISYARKITPQKPSAVAKHQLNMINLLHLHSKTSDARVRLDSVKVIIESLPMVSQDEYDVSANYYAQLAYNLNSMGQADSTIFANLQEEKIRQNSPIKDSTRLARVQGNLGNSYYNAGNINKSWEYVQKSFNIKKRILPRDNYSLASSYRMMGIHRLSQSFAINEAQQYFEEALRITKKSLGRVHPYTVIDLRYLGKAYTASHNTDKALEVYLEVLEIQLQLDKEANLVIAEIYADLAKAFRESGKYEDAKNSFDKYFAITDMITADMSAYDIQAESGLGHLLIETGEIEDGITLLQSAIDKSDKFYGQQHQFTASIHNLIAETYKNEGFLEKALESTYKSIKANKYDIIFFQEEAVPLIWLAKDKSEFIISYMLKCKILLQQAMNNSDAKLWELAWNSFDETEALLRDWIKEQNNSLDIITLQEYSNKFYGSAIEALWIQDSTGLNQDHLHKMWLYSEKAKGFHQKFKERRREAATLGEVSLNLLEKEAQLNNEITYQKSILVNKGAIDSVQSKLFDLLLEKRNFESDMKANFEGSYSLLYPQEHTSAKTLLKDIRKDQTIVDYFITDSHLFAFVLSQEGIKPFKLGLTNQLTTQINDFNVSLIKDKGESFGEGGYKLYQSVLEPLVNHISSSSLVIIPDKDLWNINFDLLLSSSPSSTDYAKHDYLLKRYSISYANSVSLLFKEIKRKNPQKTLLALAFGPNEQRDTDLKNFRDSPKENLPGTAAEVRGLSNSINGDFYYGHEASEFAFKKSAPNYSVLHLALHGEVDEENPDNSKLYFTPDTTSKVEDNTLHTFELYHMELNAELAVLSACNTGSGNIKNGEGIMSLGKAFQYAGVKSVLLSQWEVSDAIAPVIMSSFYDNLKEGMSKSESLRQAKLEFLKNSNNITSNPYYWGSFFIVGNPDPINLNPKSNHWYWVIGLLMLATLIIYRKKMA
ncbi:CHAT domain-containing protein [Roseivirga sp. E12]|uniref:CHAT domain-containing protein n=1 Tax=Roseivirga sp. E12 TaxID=2819237 RepID=UPI001ABD0174|nr:CHAT domain-containing protein [Roseivirga sp. E12]MBO3699665.1 CHAT domain-containing protein [Roseivirga sp. E12]